MKLPFVGEVDVYKVSLPILAVLMGFLDGFNPCAMWVLIFLIGVLLGMKDKKRMWTLGIAFIVASASVYFIFMSAWLNLILFLGIIIWVRLLIAGLALFGGGYSLKKFFKNKAGTCEVTEGEKKQKVFEKLKNIAKQNNLWLALGGIIVLAFAVNLVELVCSAGLPAVFTQILAMNGLPKVGYYLYILLYIFFFMLDDLIVFFVAMFTLKMTGITNKYARYSSFIGGILMIVIGILLVFKPEWLMFG
jgi:cytochrome c biogenesis protein CcdA